MPKGHCRPALRLPVGPRSSDQWRGLEKAKGEGTLMEKYLRMDQ